MTCQSYAWCCAHKNYDNIQTSVGDCHREDNCELKNTINQAKKTVFKSNGNYYITVYVNYYQT